jgi:hypothetical protein
MRQHCKGFEKTKITPEVEQKVPNQTRQFSPSFEGKDQTDRNSSPKKSNEKKHYPLLREQ